MEKMNDYPVVFTPRPVLLFNFRTQRGNIRIEPEVLHGACHLIVLDVVYGEPDVVCDVMPK